METVTVCSRSLVRVLRALDSAIHPPGGEDEARAVSDELRYLLGVARSRRRPGPAVYLFACPDREDRE